jgi:hypothetical protein
MEDSPDKTQIQKESGSSSFLEASKQSKGGLFSDAWGFMRENAKWWLLPFLIVFGLLGILLIFGSGAAAPFIYTLF